MISIAKTSSAFGIIEIILLIGIIIQSIGQIVLVVVVVVLVVPSSIIAAF